MTHEHVDVRWHEHHVSRAERETLHGHRGCVVWFTGLSGSGKSTIANLVERRLYAAGVHSYLLDGDNVRHGLNASAERLAETHSDAFARRFGLGFSAEDRQENIRRIGAVTRLFVSAGIVTLSAFVSPYRRDRDAIRTSLEEGDFIEVFVDTPLEVCQQRDPKGLYKKARAGELKGMTGVDDPYEVPRSPEIVLDAAGENAQTLADEVVAYLHSAGKLSSSDA